ncbi:MAG TPA: polyprenol monophosphomannose synthase [Solirubrobacterales bacterium]|nr:polyprenol monophosphomannose synthase [Solirubrobacterales bacterium]
MESSTVAGPAWLVLPTYNEAANIAAIVEAARANLPDDARVLIVDDNSPDGTGGIADGLAATDPAVEVLHRAGKEGLGPAYIAGFHRAIAGGAGFVLQMDSDFSHDPADLPRLLAAARDGADLAIGSRYVPGGGVTDWSLLRRAISRGGSLYASLVLGVRQRDLTGGFKCFRRRVLETIDLDAVAAKGYVFQVEMTYRTLQAGFTVREVPIVFRDRQVGESKMSAAIAAEATWQVPLLRRRLRDDHPRTSGRPRA